VDLLCQGCLGLLVLALALGSSHAPAKLVHVPALYEAPVPEFLSAEDDLIIGRLANVTRQGFSELSAEQIEAWRDQLPVLRAALSRDCAKTWHVLLEFSIPRRGKRIDAVVLSGALALVLEFKCGAKHYERSAIAQVEDYCLDLRDFHKESRRHTLIPVLIATHAESSSFPTDPTFDCVAPAWRSNGRGLGEVLELATVRYAADVSEPIDPGSWNSGEYLPTPTIIEAARLLYEGQNVREVSRCHAGAENLTRTAEAIAEAIRVARQNDQKIICFITGVPGAGKTLAGLNIIHDRHLHEGTLGAFLSGNGPLVRVLCEALARDHSERTKQPISESRRKVSTFIQNVHRFIEAHYSTLEAPPDRLVVFDEAQRAWNAEQSNRKFKRNVSEPEIMLDIMNRHKGWAVIIALVGNGQEINTGEAGLGEWGRALTSRFCNWKVCISGDLATRGTSDGETLFETAPVGLQVVETPFLHLEISIRSYKAEAVSDFVAHLLSFNFEAAHRSLSDCSEFPIVFTRDPDIAKRWLRRRQRGTRRIGLIASSGGRRLRAFGLDVRAELDVENWFLNGSGDVRSSHYLETPATEFGIQGLELDWTAVCWDLDLVPGRTDWNVQAFKGTRWQKVLNPTRRQYVINKYRVLLTRAREGMVIWVPKGDATDWTRPVDKYEAIATHLINCGISLCDEV
jgi:hypothetical protein